MRLARIFSTVLFLGASAVWASDKLPIESNTYGTAGLTWLTLAPWDFHPIDSSTTYGTDGIGIYSTGGFRAFKAGLHLPEGAVVSVLELAACDTDPQQNVGVGFVAALKTGAQVLLPGSTATDLSGGCQVVSSAPFTPWTVNNDTTYYAVNVNFGTTGITLVLNSVRVGYRLQVSPAPATATFADVPTTHIFYQYIEALAASGITSGCSVSNFCPDAPLTRGQMAVFLARALGLHWAP